MKRVFGLLLFAFWGCQEHKEKADLLVFNATIYTVDAAFSKASAFAVKNGKFIDVGSSEEILSRYESENRIDANGLTITPGLIDAHCHFYGLGLNQQVANLVGTKSFEEIVQIIKQFQEADPKDFIRGRGWDQNDWAIKEFPDKIQLDELFPETPVVLERIDGHAYIVNQRALDLAGITLETKVEGGEIVKKNGKLTGVLIDNPMALIDAIIPPLNRATQIEALKDAEQLCFKYGLTTVNDAGLGRNIIELIDSLQQAGQLSIRVYAMVGNTSADLDYFLNKGVLKTNNLNVRSVKVYGDGALGSRGAALKAPYSDKAGHFGAMVTPVAQIEALAEKIAKSEYQMNTHAIGDSANTVVLKAYKKALEGKSDRRWKIEHAQVIAATDFDYFGSGIIPSVQPTHATSDMYWAADRLGPERVQGAYAFKSLLNKAGLVVLGTDFPVEQVNPLLTFYAAVARKDLENYPEGGFQMKDALTREETLKGMTIWAAYSNFEESEKGSIEAGKFADFTIYSDNLMEIELEAIPHISVEAVYLDGKKMN